MRGAQLFGLAPGVRGSLPGFKLALGEAREGLKAGYAHKVRTVAFKDVVTEAINNLGPRESVAVLGESGNGWSQMRWLAWLRA